MSDSDSSYSAVERPRTTKAPKKKTPKKKPPSSSSSPKKKTPSSKKPSSSSSSAKKKTPSSSASSSSTKRKKPPSSARSKDDEPTNKNERNDPRRRQHQRSPAEFFAEHQSIAGFDNPGRSLYTTVRELVENSLDACESVGTLPNVDVDVEEMTESEFNEARRRRGDLGLFDERSERRKEKEKEESKNAVDDDEDENSDAAAVDVNVNVDVDVDVDVDDAEEEEKEQEEKKTSKVSPTKKKKSATTKRSTEGYFRVEVKDNGCGMAHDAIPNLLGKVLSGSKYGVRQTRGKFGLGAKMALIWSKKSTGIPIRVVTSHIESSNAPGSHVSTCVLDINVHKNEPHVLQHTRTLNDCNRPTIGTTFTLFVSGNWTTYKSRIVSYLHRLAIITPYARLVLRYSNLADPKRDMTLRYDRRSEQMPPPAREVRHHPSSVNNLLVSQLVERSDEDDLERFLHRDLAGVSLPVARRIAAEATETAEGDPVRLSSLSPARVGRLVQILRSSASAFRSPDGSCLSPLGEYNLALGIRKVVEPDHVATARDKPSAHEGHPFLVEAAVALGGRSAREGLTVFRFANRIPLLFEAGADVVTRVAQTRIKWSSYKIDHKRDKVGVFVSIVSTKIPFKGTGKEYIGDDITEIQTSVRRCLQTCCQQLRSHLVKRNAIKERNERRGKLLKYVPNVSQAVFGILDEMRKRRREEDGGSDGDGDRRRTSSKRRKTAASGEPRPKTTTRDACIERMDRKELSEQILKDCLREAVESKGTDGADDDDEATKSSAAKGGRSTGGGGGGGRKGSSSSLRENVFQPVFLRPVDSERAIDVAAAEGSVVHHPMFTFVPLRALSLFTIEAD